MPPEKTDRNDLIMRLRGEGLGYRLIRDTLAREGYGTLSLARVRQIVLWRSQRKEL